MIELHDYQRAAIGSIYSYYNYKNGHVLIVVPTAGGKSLIIAQFLKEVFAQWPDQRVLLLSHIREIIEQDYAEILRLWPAAPVGVNCAGLKRRDYDAPIIFGSIQSLYRNADRLPVFDLALIDEAHRLPRAMDTMYRALLAALIERNPHMKVIGLSATPFRLDSGLLTEGEDRLFTDIAYEIGVRELIDRGRLVPPIGVVPMPQIDTTGVDVRAGEFVLEQLEAVATDPATVTYITDDLVERGAGRNSWLVFCCGVRHGEMLRDALRHRGVAAEAVFGHTKLDERDRLIAAFKASELQALVGVNVFTTGFNATNVDLIALVRATRSTGLFIQMVGRGLRTHPGISDCLILDFGGNFERHGPIDQPHVKTKSNGHEGKAPVKICPECRRALPAALRTCECGYEFQPQERKIELAASRSSPLAPPPEWLEVDSLSYRHHDKPGKPPSLRVDYRTGLARHSEWVCFEHGGYARQKAVTWWCRRGPDVPVPDTVEEALRYVTALREPTHILVAPDGRYTKIVNARLP